MLAFNLTYDLVPDSGYDHAGNGCLHFCLHTEYLSKVSNGNIDPRAIDNYNSISQTNILSDPK